MRTKVAAHGGEAHVRGLVCALALVALSGTIGYSVVADYPHGTCFCVGVKMCEVGVVSQFEFLIL